MNDPETRKEPAPAADDATVPGPGTGGPGVPAEPLTKEEQWALFEKELKENDWGHQPC